MLNQALRLHQETIIIDGHNDTLPRRKEAGDPLDFSDLNPRYHVNLQRLQEAGYPALLCYVGARDLRASLELWEGLYRNLDTQPEAFILARRATDLHAAKQRKQIALIGQLESCACLGESLGVLGAQARLGLKVANLSHGEGQQKHDHALQVDTSPFSYCSAAEREAARHEMKGLTGFGREVIAACNELGIVVDLAHANDRTFYEALELSTQPCIFSHGCVFAVSSHWRGLTDDQIRALAAQGGVMGVAFYTKFIHPEAPSMDRLLDQVEHVIELVGADHIGFGADFDGLPDDETPIPPHMGRLVEFTAAMLKRGLDEQTVKQILGGNFLRVFEQVWG